MCVGGYCNNLSCVLHKAAVDNEIGHRLGLCQASLSLLGQKKKMQVERMKDTKRGNTVENVPQTNERTYTSFRKR